jgi:CBS domain-containing protein
MSPNPVVLQATATLQEAAQVMRDRDIGDVLVAKDGDLCGMVTDRDMVVRGIAEGKSTASLGDLCSRDLQSISPTASVEDAVKMMRDRAIRRLPVIDSGQPVGILSLGDLAQVRDRASALADISSAPGNQ